MHTLLDLAQHYVGQLHWSVIPVFYKQTDSGVEKCAAVKWKEFQTRRATQDDLQSWFGGRYPALGIVTGAISGLSVVDCDNDEASQFIKGVYPFETLTVKTKRGRHYYFQYEKDLKTVANVFEDVDVRSDGGMVVAPPSPYTDNSGQYHYIDPATPIARMPPALLRALKEKRCAEFTSTSTIDELVDGIAATQEGSRNQKLFLNACRIYNALSLAPDTAPVESVEERILKAAIACGLDEASARATMQSARKRAYRLDENGVVLGDAKMTHAEAADAVAMKFPDLVWLHDEQVWLEYDAEKGYWPVLHESQVTARIIGILDRGMPRYTISAANSVRDILKARVGRMARDMEHPDDVLVFRNMAVAMKDANPMPKDRNLFARSYIDIDIDPDATCPEFARFVEYAFHPAVLPMVQEYCGYCLTKDTRHGKFMWLYSERGGAGKSKFIEAVSNVLGEDNVGILPVARIGDRFSLSQIIGRRLVVATEAGDDYIKQCDTLNAIVTGDKVWVEEKFKEPFKVKPYCKLMYSANNLPRVNANDGSASGTFRRFLVVEMKCVPEDRQDPDLSQKLAQEKEGILWWMMLGLIRLIERGRFEVPEEVRALNRETIELNDAVQAFLDERYDITGAEGDFMNRQGIYAGYTAYCTENGLQPLSSKRLGLRLVSLGARKDRTSGSRGFRGIRLKPA